MANKLKDFKLSTEIYTSNEVDGLVKNLSSDEIHFTGNIVGLSGNITSTDYNPDIAGSIAINGVVKTPDSIAIGCKNRNMISGYAIADASLCCRSDRREYGNAFAFGYNAKAYNYCAFAFGSGEAAGEYAVAIGGGEARGTTSFAGSGAKADGNYSFAYGQTTTHAKGNISFAVGSAVSALGTCSHAEGEQTAAVGKSSHAEGYDTKANGVRSHAEGDRTVADGEGSHTEGQTTKATGAFSHAEGIAAEANGKYSHAEGWTSIAGASHYDALKRYLPNDAVELSGKAFICQISSMSADPKYPSGTTESTDYWKYINELSAMHSQHAEGYHTQAIGQASHAEGYETKAIGDRSCAMGLESIAKDDRSFVWNGTWSKYESSGVGTFNVNPQNGLSGFYVGGKSLADCLAGVEHKPLSGKSYDGNTELSTLLFDVISALGGTISF